VYPENGGLLSYRPDIKWAYRLLGEYAGRILKGEKPSDLPIQQPTNFDFVINLKTAKALGIEVSPMMQVRAHDLIE
jgi:putative ABC transport system substrate-binding protein